MPNQIPDLDFLNVVGKLARDGLNQQQIAARIGVMTTTSLMARLVRASQATGKPVPNIGRGRTKSVPKRVEMVTVARRGKGESYGVNIPEEPLRRAGIKMGDSLQVTVRGGRVFLKQ